MVSKFMVLLVVTVLGALTYLFMSTFVEREIVIKNLSGSPITAKILLLNGDSSSEWEADLLSGKKLAHDQVTTGKYNMIDSYNGDSCIKYVIQVDGEERVREYPCDSKEITVTQ